MSKHRECVVWVDAHSKDDWTHSVDIKLAPAVVETLGRCIGENSKVLCIAQSVDEKGDYCAGLFFIPKACILSRRTIKLGKKKRKK